ncbi:MAG: hypothetical protein AB8D78_09020 [Akkermansiaceae bacterium]
MYHKKVYRQVKTQSLIQSLIVAVGFTLFGQVSAQSGDFYDSEDSKEAREKNQAAVKKMLDLPDPKPIEPDPSRFTGKKIEPYVLERAAVFSMRNRAEDPFMLTQDTTVKPQEKKIAPRKPRNRRAALPPTPLAEIVSLIRVTTIMPSEKKFLVGMRSFKESDEFSLKYKGKTMQMKVMEVTARKIIFQDLAKKESATLEMKMLPPGMIAGGDKIQPPGLVSQDSTLPLLLGGGDTTFIPNN